jgi:hypothetical protein
VIYDRALLLPAAKARRDRNGCLALVASALGQAKENAAFEIDEGATRRPSRCGEVSKRGGLALRRNVRRRSRAARRKSPRGRMVGRKGGVNLRHGFWRGRRPAGLGEPFRRVGYCRAHGSSNMFHDEFF